MPRFNDTDYTAESLAKMNGMSIVALYNAAVEVLARHPGPTGDTSFRAVTKFSDKATAVKRTLAVLELAEQARQAKVDPPKSKGSDETAIDIFGDADRMAKDRKGSDETAKDLKALTGVDEKAKAPEAPAPKPKTERKPREPRFVFPLGSSIKAHRPGTARDKAVQLLSRPEGATFEEVGKATGWDTFKKCYEGIRLLHFYLGYGMRQDAAGRIYLRTK